VVFLQKAAAFSVYEPFSIDMDAATVLVGQQPAVAAMGADDDEMTALAPRRDSAWVLEDRSIVFMVIMNRYPYINGHLLVMPVRHVPTLDALSEEESLDLIIKVRKTINILKQEMSPDGFNVGLNLGKVAGAGVEKHMHFHIVPRWNGDTNYMTVLGDVRVIPEHIRETYKQLLPYFKKL
jgi:ATP adenylyltransferase